MRFYIAPDTETKMKENQFPSGWDEERIKRVIAYYEAQTKDEAVVEDEKEVINDKNKRPFPIPHY
jgi:hypothetical protein